MWQAIIHLHTQLLHLEPNWVFSNPSDGAQCEYAVAEHPLALKGLHPGVIQPHQDSYGHSDHLAGV